MDNKFILHTRRNELVRKVQKHTSSLFISGIQSIYEVVKRNNKVKKYLLKEFQKSLADISIWSQEILKNEHIRFAQSFPMFDKVIKNILDIQTKLHGHKHIEINCTDFMHQCYLNIARSVWKQPFLVYDVGVNKLDVQKNNSKLEKLIADGIRDTFEHFLPLEDDDIDFYEPGQLQEHVAEHVAEYIATKQTIDKLETPCDVVEDDGEVLSESDSEETESLAHVDEHGSDYSDYSVQSDHNYSEKEGEGNEETLAGEGDEELEGSLAGDNEEDTEAETEEEIEDETYETHKLNEYTVYKRPSADQETSVCDIENIHDMESVSAVTDHSKEVLIETQPLTYEPQFDVDKPHTPSINACKNNDVKNIVLSGHLQNHVQEIEPSLIIPSDDIKVVNFEEMAGKVKSLLSLKKKVKSSMLNSHLHNPSFF
jgi:hypothetical protein